jgi:hypothetical protein
MKMFQRCDGFKLKLDVFDPAKSRRRADAVSHTSKASPVDTKSSVYLAQDPHPSQRYWALPASQKLHRRTLQVEATGSPNIYPKFTQNTCKSMFYIK